jgi:uncharacterized membrane protein
MTAHDLAMFTCLTIGWAFIALGLVLANLPLILIAVAVFAIEYIADR